MRKVSNPAPAGSEPGRYVVLGSAGRLGTALTRAFSLPGELTALTREDLDIRDLSRVREALSGLRPAAVLNAAAYNDVDRAEDDRDGAFALNAAAVRGLAEACRDLGAAFVHFSTDYVFDGRKGRPYREDDAPGPLSVYAESKLEGERLALEACPRTMVLRVCGLYGQAESRERSAMSFVERMLAVAGQGRSLRVVCDQVLAPSYAADLAAKVWKLLPRARWGVCHLTNSGATSWHDFAAAAFRLAGVRADLRPVAAAEYAVKARRPRYSVLEHAVLRELGEADLRPWDEALAAYLREREHGRKQA